MNASKASLFCLLLCACSSDSGGSPSGAGGFVGMLTNGGAAGGVAQPGAGGGALASGGAATNPLPGAGGMAMQGNGGVAINPGSGGAGGSLPGAGGIAGAPPGAGGTMGGMGGTSAAGGGSTATGGMGGGTMGSAMGCGTTTLLASSGDPSAKGPWPVGEKTFSLTRAGDNVSFKVEVMYPAQVGSDAGKQVLKYDMRTWLPDSERSKVTDANATYIDGGTYADLPLDASHGPYPLVVMVHGTGAFRVASFTTQATWASHGFVVVAADHPGLFLSDYMKANGCAQVAPAENLSADVDAEMAAVKGASGDWAFLSGHVDTTRVGLAGHSAGAFNVAQFSNKPGVQVVIPLAGTHVVNPSSSLKSVAFIGGIADKVLGYTTAMVPASLLYPGTQVSAYQGSPGSPVKKRLMGITGGGHLCVTDLCPNPGQMSTLAVGMASGVCGLMNLLPLFDCGTSDKAQSIKAVDDLSTAVLEETLQCQDLASVISATKSRNSVVGDFQESK